MTSLKPFSAAFRTPKEPQTGFTMNDKKLYDFVDPTDAECVIRDIEISLSLFLPDFQDPLFRLVFTDVRNLFCGEYPGYKASNTKYHDFEHTCAVTLATGRLICGAMAEGHAFDRLTVLKGLLAAIFHDVGLIQTADDEGGTGAKHMVGHEERSIQFMLSNLGDSLPEEDLEDIAQCIHCTSLDCQVNTVPFRSPEMRMIGQCVGAGDLLAQLADRYYLEKLILLFQEFEEAGIPGYDTPYDLLQKTTTFYRDVAQKRLKEALGQADMFMISYFRSRWSVEKDFYREAIDRNLEFLETILNSCGDDIDCFTNALRRNNLSAYTE